MSELLYSLLPKPRDFQRPIDFWRQKWRSVTIEWWYVIVNFMCNLTDHYSWVYLWACFYRKWIFATADWVKHIALPNVIGFIQLTEVLNTIKGCIRKTLVLSVWTQTDIGSGTYTISFLVFRPLDSDGDYTIGSPDLQFHNWRCWTSWTL